MSHKDNFMKEPLSISFLNLQFLPLDASLTSAHVLAETLPTLRPEVLVGSAGYSLSKLPGGALGYRLVFFRY